MVAISGNLPESLCDRSIPEDCSIHLLRLVTSCIALLARLHLHGLLPLKDIGSYLGLDSSSQNENGSKSVGVARAQFRPGEIGVVRKMKVVSLSDMLPSPLPLGTVLYEIILRDGSVVEIPEEEIVSEV